MFELKVGRQSLLGSKKSVLYRGILRFVISLIFLAGVAFFYRETLPAVFSSLWKVSLPPFLASLAVFAGVVAFNARRLTLFLHFHSININFGRVFYYNLLALFVNIFLPTSIGGDAVKAYCLHGISGCRQEVFGLVILDRFFGLLCLVTLSFIALVFSGPGDLPLNIQLTMFFMLVLIVLGVIFLLHPGIAALIDKLQSKRVVLKVTQQLPTIYSAMQLFRYPGRIILKAFYLSLGAQFLYILNYYLLSKSLGIDLSLTFFVFFLPVNAILSLAPSVSGLGVRETAYLVYATHYIVPEEALALSLLHTFSLLLAGCLGGCVYVVSNRCGAGTKCKILDEIT